TMLALARSPTRAVYDLYAPLTIEHAALASRRDRPAGASFELDELTLRVALETGDAFVCAGERQRDLWLGALAALGRVDPETYRRDPSFRSLVAVAPFGVDPDPPAAGARVLKGVVPGIAETDAVALWGGGVWEWLDPLTVIRAVHLLARDDLKLYFLGTRSPNPAVPAMTMQRRARELAAELGLAGRTVFFNDGWVPYETRGAYLLEADVGVSAHFDELETRFAFRNRLLDCVWAGLPIVTTEGDELAELVRARGLGRAVPPEDAESYAAALAAVLDSGRSAFAAAAAEARRGLAWPAAVAPLAALVAGARSPAGASPRPARLLRYAALRGRAALDARGAGGTAARLAAGVVRRARGELAARPPAAERREDEPLR